MKQGLTFLALLALAVAAAWYSLTPRFPIAQGLDLKGGMRVVLEPDPTKEGGAHVSPDLLSRVRDVLENRVNSFGLSGTEVRLKGSNQILILLPGVKNPQEALSTISKVAQLEFRHLNNVQSDRNPGARFRMGHSAGDATKGEPETYTFTDTSTNKTVPETEVLKDAPLIVNGKYLQPTSRAEINPTNGQPEVTFEFNKDGAERFGQFTTDNVGEILAVVLDNKVISAPNIKEPITGGNGQISGGFATMAEARSLANLLNSGALPVPMRPAQTEVVGATLGQDSIDKSIRAGAIGLALVLVFMLAYYWLPGAIACIALLIYAALTFSIFKGVGLFPPIVLDLPGITGFILSVGMAVDANILIFERLKEELRSGKSLHAAIDAGFSRAFSAILDSNVTTWIVCAILIWLGTPIIKGFAITLVIGVVVSMFTAITVTRNILHLVIAMPWARNEGLYGLNSGWLQLVFPAVRRGAVLKVFEKRWVYLGVSIASSVVALIFIAMTFVGHGLKPGIDFTGGTVVEAAYHQPVTQDQVRGVLPKGLDATISIAKSEQSWTKVTVEARDVDDLTTKKIEDRLSNASEVRGFDKTSYKAENGAAPVSAKGSDNKPAAASATADKANAPAEAKAGNSPAANAPAANAPAANAPAANAPAANAPAANAPAANAPAANAPAANAPADKKGADSKKLADVKKPETGKPAGKLFRATMVFTSPVAEADIRHALNTKTSPDDVNLDLKDLNVTTSAETHQGEQAIPVALIQSRTLQPDELAKLRDDLQTIGGGVVQSMYQESSIGPSIAKEVTWNAFYSVVVASCAIILYLAFRFAIGGFVNGLKFGSSAVVALIHDVGITIGFFALMGALRGWQVDSLFVTACLTVLGFSVHDTIVVYDRIRENLRHRQRGETFADVTDRSVTQTFDRSINTSFTVMLVVAALVIFGGETIRLFNIALLFGIAIGTYSSVFVASPLVVLLEQAGGTGTSQLAAVGGAPAPRTAARRDDVALTPSRRQPTTPAARPTPTAPRPTATTIAPNTDADDSELDGDEDQGAGRNRPGAIKPKRKRRL